MKNSIRISFYYLRTEWRRVLLTTIAIALGMALFPLLSGLLAEMDRPGSLPVALRQGLSFIAGLVALSLASLAAYHHMSMLLHECAGELAMLRVCGFRREGIQQILFIHAGIIVVAGSLVGGLAGVIPFTQLAAGFLPTDAAVSSALLRGYAGMLFLGLPAVDMAACWPVMQVAKRDFLFQQKP
jgi:hypothetical protein